MPPPLSDDLKERIVKWYYEDQDTMAEIAAQARYSIGLVSKVLRYYREYGQVRDPFRQHTGRPSKLSEADLKYIDTIVTANPSLYLDEIQQRLRDVRDVEVSIATLARALVSLELTRKQVSKAASERDEGLRSEETKQPSYQCLICFVWLWEWSRGHACKKVGFHKIMQTTVC